MREIKFRCWHNKIHTIKDGHYITYGGMLYDEKPGDCLIWKHQGQDIESIMQYTGLHDKNGLTELWEGDIIDENGVLKGNIYESPQIFREGVDLIIAGMGTSTWRNTESIAMGRGCKYA